MVQNLNLLWHPNAVRVWATLLAVLTVLILAACESSEPPSTAAGNNNSSLLAVPEQSPASASSNATGPKRQATEPFDEHTSAGPATVLVLGDSISAAYGIQREKGWVALLQQHLRSIDENFTAVNASISGETTGGGLSRFAQVLEQHRPQVTVIELGGNDGLRGYPLTQVKNNLTKLVQMAKDANSLVLVLGMQIPPNYGARYSNGFAKLFSDVASDQQVPLVPSFLEQVALTPGMLQADGIHPVQAAQPMLLQTVIPELTKLLPTP